MLAAWPHDGRGPMRRRCGDSTRCCNLSANSHGRLRSVEPRPPKPVLRKLSLSRHFGRVYFQYRHADAGSKRQYLCRRRDPGREGRGELPRPGRDNRRSGLRRGYGRAAGSAGGLSPGDPVAGTSKAAPAVLVVRQPDGRDRHRLGDRHHVHRMAPVHIPRRHHRKKTARP